MISSSWLHFCWLVAVFHVDVGRAIDFGEWSQTQILVDFGRLFRLDYAVASVGAAGLVLPVTDRRLKRSASVQLIPALAYLIAH